MYKENGEKYRNEFEKKIEAYQKFTQDDHNMIKEIIGATRSGLK